MKVETLRAVLEAARSWRAEQSGLATLFDAPARDLIEAVDAFEAELPEAHIESVEMDKPWAEIREGMWVQAPNGEWYEVVECAPWREDEGHIPVGLSINGKTAVYPRDPAGIVRVRVSFPDPMVRAVSLLAETFGATVIERS